MTLFAKGKPLKTYSVSLGRSAGDKERQGDHKTPLGQYLIDQKNAQSRFHLALHISYPNNEDRNRAQAAKTDPGGSIMIHGLPDRFAWLGSLQRQTKALDIPVIVVFEGWSAAGKGTLINELILPLDPRGFTVHSAGGPTQEEAYYPFLWRFWKFRGAATKATPERVTDWQSARRVRGEGLALKLPQCNDSFRHFQMSGRVQAS